MQYALTVICIIAVDEIQISDTCITNTAYLYFTLCMVVVEGFTLYLKLQLLDYTKIGKSIIHYL